MGDPPLTYVADPYAMRDELDYEEMVALSGMFRRWAIYEAAFTPEQRTGLTTWCADLERLAEWVGKGWRAVDPPERPLLKFLARLERDIGDVDIGRWQDIVPETCEEKTWLGAKPLFIRAASGFVEVARDIDEVTELLVQELRAKHGLTQDGLAAMRPYLLRFKRISAAKRMECRVGGE